MEEKLSLTAIMSAYLRAYHSLHDEPKIFDDFLAHHIIPEERQALIEQGLVSSLKFTDPHRAALCPDQATALAWVIRAMSGPPHVLSRSRYTEEILKKLIRQGVEQYVILGAGLDTFAFRCPELVKQIRVYEVDHPVTQAFKRQRLNELKWELPSNLNYAPVDFKQENLAAALAQAGYDPQAKSFFSWLGVTMYLNREEIFATLHTIADIAPAGSTVIFDCLDTDAFTPEKAAPRVQGGIRLAQQAGEPMKTGFDPSTLAADITPLGLRIQESLSPADIEKRYFQGRTDGYYACEHVHFVRAVIE